MSLILTLLSSSIVKANECAHYFEDLKYKDALRSMRVSYVEEKVLFILDGEIQVATILPDTNTVLGRMALELMQYPIPVVLRVSNFQNMVGVIPEKGFAFFTSEQIYPSRCIATIKARECFI